MLAASRSNKHLILQMQNWASAPVVADAELMYEDISSEQDQDPDSVIAMAISSDIFQWPAEKIKKWRAKKFKKVSSLL